MIKYIAPIAIAFGFVACGGAPAAPEAPGMPDAEEPSMDAPEEPSMDAPEEPAMDDAAPEEPAAEDPAAEEAPPAP